MRRRQVLAEKAKSEKNYNLNYLDAENKQDVKAETKPVKRRGRPRKAR